MDILKDQQFLKNLVWKNTKIKFKKHHKNQMIKFKIFCKIKAIKTIKMKC